MMARSSVRFALACALASPALGCASTSPDAAFRDVATVVEERTGRRVRWHQGTAEDAEVERAVQALLKAELDADGAVQVALLNNRTLQAAYEDLSVAQADLVQAGLLHNPVFGGSVRLPASGGGGPNVELGVSQDFLSLLMLPARKRVASAELERTKLRVADEVLGLAHDVRAAFYELQGAQQIVEMDRLIASSADTSAELSKRQSDAGNLSDLGLASARAMAAEARLDLARDELEARTRREELTRLLGLWGASTTFRVAPRLAAPPAEDPSLEHLERLAITQRLDVAAARKETESIASALAMTEDFRWLGGAEIGASAEREPEGSWVVGPEASIELPIFDQHGGEIARVDAELRRSRARLYALAVDVRSEVRAARDRVLYAHRVAEHYRDVLIPLREQIVALTQQEYDAMLIGVYELMASKQVEVATYRQYIAAIRDYWIARAALERAVGGRLAGSTPAPAPSEAPKPPAAPAAPSHAGH